MAMPPHAAMNAPSGARKPRTLTEVALSFAELPKVVAKMSQAQMMAAITPQA